MTLIVWKREFEIGIPGVDFEHEHLIGLINGLYKKLEDHPSTPAISDVLAEIYAKISSHFALEEKIMQDRRYDEYAEHKADHERLLDEIRDIMDSFDKNPAFAYKGALIERLTPWFTVHFKTKDARFHKAIE